MDPVVVGFGRGNGEVFLLFGGEGGWDHAVDGVRTGERDQGLGDLSHDAGSTATVDEVPALVMEDVGEVGSCIDVCRVLSRLAAAENCDSEGLSFLGPSHDDCGSCDKDGYLYSRGRPRGREEDEWEVVVVVGGA